MKALTQNQVIKNSLASFAKDNSYAEWKEEALAQLAWLEEFVNMNKAILQERGQFTQLLAEIHTAKINVELDFCEERIFFDKKWLQESYKNSQKSK